VISPSDNEASWREALATLAPLVEAGRCATSVSSNERKQTNPPRLLLAIRRA
jgi:hypothetical protein